MDNQTNGRSSRSRAKNGKVRSTDGKPVQDLLTHSVPPQNLDAERAVIGSVLRDNACLSEVVKKIEVDSFYSATNQRIFRTIVKMYDAGKPIDVLTLADELQLEGSLLEVGGAPTLASFFDETLTAANVLYYSQIVHDKAVLRSLINASTEILRDAYEGSDSPDTILSETERRIFSILEKRLGGSTQTMNLVLKKAFDRINQRQGRDGSKIGGVPSGFYDLDELTDGWQNSELIILAARPSMGKTALALNFCEYAAVHSQPACPTLFISLEMSELELGERMLCAHGRVNGHMLRKNRLDSDEMFKLINASNDLSKAPIYIDDSPGQTMLRISATARRLKLRHGLRFILIDYLQLIEPDDKNVNRVEQISTISRRLKQLARELKVPVMALSQLNRSVETREGHRPRMSDLRESGSIEQDADVVLLLHREDFYGSQEKPGEAELIIAKQRNGPVGDVKMTFRKELTRFENYHKEIAPFTTPGVGGDPY